MATRPRKVQKLEDARLRRHAVLEDEARWRFVVDDDARAALRPAREAMRTWGKCYEGYVLLGAILRDLGRPADAVRAFRSAARLHPDVAEAYWEIGEVYAGRKRWDRALAEYRRARALLRRGERDLRAFVAEGEVTALLALGHFEEALVTARAALRTLRQEPELRRLRDLALRRRHLEVVHTRRTSPRNAH
jgi:tetratricopeptide (TPR) repeat protein